MFIIKKRSHVCNIHVYIIRRVIHIVLSVEIDNRNVSHKYLSLCSQMVAHFCHQR